MRLASKGQELIGIPLLFDRMERWSAGLVNVTITPVNDPPRYDSDGRLLHCILSFPRPPRAVDVGYRQLAPYAADGTAINAEKNPVQIECDGGCYYLSSGASLSLVGGNAGDEYDVTVTVDYPRLMLDRLTEAWLTTFQAATPRGRPLFGKYHTATRVLAGAATLNGVAMAPMVEVPRGQYVLVANGGDCTYQTGTRF